MHEIVVMRIISLSLSVCLSQEITWLASSKRNAGVIIQLLFLIGHLCLRTSTIKTHVGKEVELVFSIEYNQLYDCEHNWEDLCMHL